MQLNVTTEGGATIDHAPPADLQDCAKRFGASTLPATHLGGVVARTSTGEPVGCAFVAADGTALVRRVVVVADPELRLTLLPLHLARTAASAAGLRSSGTFHFPHDRFLRAEQRDSPFDFTADDGFEQRFLILHSRMLLRYWVRIEDTPQRGLLYVPGHLEAGAWLPTARELRGSAALMELPGYGGSDAPTGHARVSVFASAIAAVLSELEADYAFAGRKIDVAAQSVAAVAYAVLSAHLAGEEVPADLAPTAVPQDVQDPPGRFVAIAPSLRPRGLGRFLNGLPSSALRLLADAGAATLVSAVAARTFASLNTIDTATTRALFQCAFTGRPGAMLATGQRIMGEIGDHAELLTDLLDGWADAAFFPDDDRLFKPVQLTWDHVLVEGMSGGHSPFDHPVELADRLRQALA